jgi:hypothetical protein
MTRQLTAISDSVKNLLDALEAADEAAGDPREEPDDPVSRRISHHPRAYAVAMLGLGLLGARLIARARRRPPADTQVTS